MSGQDSSKFEISKNGILSLKENLDFENPIDPDKNNSYQVNVIATNNSNKSSNQEITVNIFDQKPSSSFYKANIPANSQATNNDPIVINTSGNVYGEFSFKHNLGSTGDYYKLIGSPIQSFNYKIGSFQDWKSPKDIHPI